MALLDGHLRVASDVLEGLDGNEFDGEDENEVKNFTAIGIFIYRVRKTTH